MYKLYERNLCEIPVPEPSSALIEHIVVHEAHAEFLQPLDLKKGLFGKTPEIDPSRQGTKDLVEYSNNNPSVSVLSDALFSQSSRS